MNRRVPPLRTYSHLEGERRVPTEYEIVTTNLLYYPSRGFEVEVPVRAWYDRYQRGGGLACADWEGFRDPRETTYTSYTALQSRQEVHLQEVGRSWQVAEASEAARWRDTFATAGAPLRFALHGFQMVAAYIGSMAPGGRITIAASFQAADEIRRIHGIARRMAELRRTDPSAPEQSREQWQTLPQWQPLRRAVETALVAFDWGEALVALDLCLKPLCEELFLTELGRLARKRGDFFLGELLASFDEDARWHRAWSAELVRLALAERPENGTAIRSWIDRWYPLGREAVRAAAPLLGDGVCAGHVEARAEQFLASVAR
jgi:toluene monooxygenase system protein E